MCSCEYRSCKYSLRWSSLWGHEACEWCVPKCVARTHANLAIGAFGVAPHHEASEGCAEMDCVDACEPCHSHGATKRVSGVP
eukprot:9460740-Pyramimonas_sp.AAC.1